MKIYIASSWKNMYQDIIVNTLKGLNHDVYDFKDSDGFHWSEVGVKSNAETFDTYSDALKNIRREAGFQRDLDALKSCDICILVLPCGRSAHLKLGYAVGTNKRTAILFDSQNLQNIQPELMYKMVDFLAPNIHSLLNWI